MDSREELKQREKSGKAAASLILGIVSMLTSIFIIVGILLGLAGLLIGSVALLQAKRYGHARKGMAVAGMVTSIAGIALTIFFISVSFDSFFW
ncbi:DUF4190 domain-containing protein [Alkalicoccus daliensis]|uniref:DUF4190 domain-containing protein n=1 Tax=Alkalicoccus daliensis TaxID=745820 RepID=A0A1H0CWU6_9BACI|nr:DUF4190 domain-containing protein [Alkalicoccus daliensis]SDN62355.1 protein of unknown function [Alkalicoccus daliensis]